MKQEGKNMKECNGCKETMFDGATMCGICRSEDFNQLTIQKPKPKKESKPFFKRAKTPKVDYDTMTDVYRVKSNSSNKTYEIDINDLKKHKGDCLGYRYNQNCKHLDELRQQGVAV